MLLWLLLPVPATSERGPGWWWWWGSQEKQCDNLLLRSCHAGSVHLLTPIADPDTRPASSNTAAEFLHCSSPKKLVAEGKNQLDRSFVSSCAILSLAQISQLRSRRVFESQCDDCLITISSSLFSLRSDIRIALLIIFFFFSFPGNDQKQDNSIASMLGGPPCCLSVQEADVLVSCKFLFEFLFLKLSCWSYTYQGESRSWINSYSQSREARGCACALVDG